MLSMIFRLFLCAIMARKKRKYVPYLLAGIIIAVFITWAFETAVLILPFIVGLLWFFFTGYIYYREEIVPDAEFREYFQKLFEAENQNNPHAKQPQLLSSEKISPFIMSYKFQSSNPLELWNKKKGYIEMHLNKKVIYIKQNANNPQEITLYVQIQPLITQIMWEDQYRSDGDIFRIGISIFGYVEMNLEKDPHAFVAGETGSGKSNILKCMIHQALRNHYDVVLIDFKRGVSFAEFNNAITVYYEYSATVEVLKSMVNETKARLDKFREKGVDNLRDYNMRTLNFLNRKVIFIDELAELLRTKDKETAGVLYESIETLTRLSRAVGIHLIMGIQRPDSTVISGQIKNNVSFRMCGRFVDREPSRIVLGSDIASTLPNIKGRFIVKEDTTHEVQCFYFQPSDLPYPQSNSVKSLPKKAQEETKIMDTENPKIKRTSKTTIEKQVTEIEFDFSDLKK